MANNSRHRNLGMALEMLIEYSNKVYEQKDIAVIHKRPTPVKILKTSGTVDRWGRKGTTVTGHLEKPSTVDFDGVYKGRAIYFEAKSTEDPKKIPLANFKEHQIEHLRKTWRHGAVIFAIIEFVAHKSFWLVPGEFVISAWDDSVKNKGKRGSQSISFEQIAEAGCEIKNGRGAPLDYLACLPEFFINV